MIRHKAVWEKHKSRLEQMVDLGNPPDEKDLVQPFRNVLPSLYNSNNYIHTFHQSLGKSLHIDDVVDDLDILTRAESDAEILLATSYDYPPYMRLCAKISDAGDRLDRALIEAIEYTAAKFRKDYHKIKRWEPGHGSVKDTRNRLSNTLDRFLNTYHMIFLQRGLPEQAIASSRKLFVDYSKKLSEHENIDREIRDIKSDYLDSTNKEQMAMIVNKMKKDAKRSFRGNTLYERCRKSDYVERGHEITSLLSEVKKVYKNLDYYLQKRIDIEKDTDVLKAYLDEIGQIKDYDEQDIKRLLRIRESIPKHRSKELFLRRHVIGYRKIQSNTRKKTDESLKHALKTIKISYIKIKETSKRQNEPGKLYLLNDQLQMLHDRSCLLDEELSASILRYISLNKERAGKLVYDSMKSNFAIIARDKRISEQEATIDTYSGKINHLMAVYGVTQAKLDATGKELRQTQYFAVAARKHAEELSTRLHEKEHMMQMLLNAKTSGDATSFPLYLDTLGYPENTSLFPLYKTLKKGSYPDRFQSAAEQLSRLPEPDTAQDYEWSQGLLHAAKHAMQSGFIGNQMRKYPKIASRFTKAADEYITRSNLKMEA